jgi:hypothetical protein
MKHSDIISLIHDMLKKVQKDLSQDIPANDNVADAINLLDTACDALQEATILLDLPIE